MKHDPSRTGWFDRLMAWAEKGEPDLSQEVEADPERDLFMDYLQYLDSHEYLEYEEYQQLCLGGSAHLRVGGHGVQRASRRPAEQRRRRRPGRLRLLVRLYRVLTVGVTGVMAAALVLVSLALPAFGDPEAPAVNEVSGRYVERGVEETGATNVVSGLILDYRAFDTLGENILLCAACISVMVLLPRPARAEREYPVDPILRRTGKAILPAILMLGIYVVFSGHISPGGGFPGGTLLGCGLILCSLVLGREQMARLLPPRRLGQCSAVCLLAYGGLKGYLFFSGANQSGWTVPKGTPGSIFSGGLILPLNICVALIVACAIYAFYELFSQGRES